MKSLLYAVLSLLILSQTVMADDISSAEKELKSKLDAVFVVLQKNDLEQETKNNEVIEIVTPIFAFSLMPRLSLGTKYWTGLTKENKKRFTDLFVKRLKESYLEKLNLYTNEIIVYGAPVQVKKKIHIPTELISKDNKIDMLYKLYKSKSGWKIYDIEIQGVSIISTYRSQFAEVMSTGTIDDLLLKLEKQEKEKNAS
ncbi:MAG: ABC transporter substrate-binding protein [Desulfobacterales bacterium]